jgi:Xaa-Pro dipeptidase
LILEEGMVFTAEPGIYLPNIGGIRIEDDILVTADGHRVLTSYTKELDKVIIR